MYLERIVSDGGIISAASGRHFVRFVKGRVLQILSAGDNFIIVSDQALFLVWVQPNHWYRNCEGLCRQFIDRYRPLLADPSKPLYIVVPPGSDVPFSADGYGQEDFLVGPVFAAPFRGRWRLAALLAALSYRRLPALIITTIVYRLRMAIDARYFDLHLARHYANYDSRKDVLC